jgi:hypothetical protein
VRVSNEKNKKYKNQRSKIKMTNQNAKILAFASSLRGAFFPCHCEKRSDEAIWVGGQEIATHPAGARNDRTGNEGK